MQTPESQHINPPEPVAGVLRYGDCGNRELVSLLGQFGLALVVVDPGNEIPGSYWGDEEAGLVGHELVVRADTPIHSILHEACHFICMDSDRRRGLHTDAGGDYDEENAVCYLQVLLGERLTDMGRERMFQDMNSWGYSFRLGSAQAWFEQDADDARQWLEDRNIIDSLGAPSGQLRESP